MTTLSKRIAAPFVEFWAGLVTATTASWVAAACMCALELAACCIYFNTRRLAQLDPRWLMQSAHDEYLPLSLNLLRLRQSKLEGVHVAYFGASQATRALFDTDDGKLSDVLTAEAGIPAHFHSLSANNERYEDILGATDQLPPSFRGIVVAMVTDTHDDYGRYKTAEALARAREHIAFASAPSLQPIWNLSNYHPRNTGIFFLDHLGFFAARREVGARLGPIARVLRSQGQIDWDKRQKGEQELEEERDLLDEPGPNRAKRRAQMRAPLLWRSARVLDALIDNMSARGIELVILDAPILPLRAEVYEQRITRYHHDLEQLAQTRGIRFWDFDDQLDLRDADFQDKVHLATPMKRRKFETLLMRNLGAVIREDFSGPDEHAATHPSSVETAGEARHDTDAQTE
ncbi:MAG TPA: SGNH/GDSL hydrolase family protein [Byssovorax sp.]